MKKQFLILFAFISVLALSQVPQRFNKVIVTGDITSPKFIKTGSNADSVLLGNGSARAISTIKTDTVSLSNRINAKATGSGTASGTNTGDETLTSIKTKLGAATPVSDGYLRYQDFADFSDRVSNATHTGDVTGSTALTLATVNSNVGTYNNVTINAKGLATAGSNVSYEPAFSKNSGFNLPLGNTPGTVLEGDGTAANSTLWNSQGYTNSPQPADYIMATDGNGAWGYITKPNFKSSLGLGTAANSAVGDFQPAITGLSNNYFPKWNGSNFVNSQIIEFSNNTKGFFRFGDGTLEFLNNSLSGYIPTRMYSSNFIFDAVGTVRIESTTPSNLHTNGALVVNGGIGTDHVRANNFYGNGSNLTGVQLPITLTTNGTSGAATFSGNVLNVPNYTSSGSFIQNQSSSAQSGSMWVSGNIISNNKIEGITISTESVDINTSGAQINFYGTSGSGVLSQPFRGLNYKKVMIYLANFVGNNNINYLTAFTYPPVIVITDGLSSSLITSKSTTSVTITSASSATGILILEGY